MTAHIPITVLSGYLGSGKTTIINNVLAQPHGMRLAVMVNDFGPINIDVGLIASADGETIELSNGCVCCSIGDELGDALSAVAAWDNPPDRVLLEASGIAEPARIAMTVGYWPGFSLDAVIVAADVETVRQRAADKFVGTLVRSQLKSADIVVLTKTDLVPEAYSLTCKKWLTEQPSAPNMLEARQGRVPSEILFGPARGAGHQRGFVSGDGHAVFSSSVWHPGRAVDLARLKDVLSSLPATVHRAKGYVTDRESGKPMLVQAVGRRSELSPAPADAADGLVFIATSVGPEIGELCARLEATLA